MPIKKAQSAEAAANNRNNTSLPGAGYSPLKAGFFSQAAYKTNHMGLTQNDARRLNGVNDKWTKSATTTSRHIK